MLPHLSTLCPMSWSDMQVTIKLKDTDKDTNKYKDEDNHKETLLPYPPILCAMSWPDMLVPLQRLDRYKDTNKDKVNHQVAQASA